MKVISYFLYGNRKEYQLELVFSILSALRFLKGNHTRFTICVISDESDFNFDLPVDRIIYSRDEFNKWTQDGRYNHRAKIYALMKAIDQYQSRVILIDTDTYFIDSPARLFQRVSPEHSVMNAFEKTLDTQIWRWRPIVEKIGNGVEICGVSIFPHSPMFNSGVVGIDVSDRSLLEKSLSILDELYALSPVFNVEQFALGLVLNQFTKLSVCPDIVEHYWGYRRKFVHLQIARLLKDFDFNLDKLATGFPPPNVGYPHMSFTDRVWARVLGLRNQWDSTYRFGYLAYRSAFSYASKDNDYANAWADVALQALNFSLSTINTDQNHTVRFIRSQSDFARFRKEALENLAWLDSDVKKNWVRYWDSGCTV